MNSGRESASDAVDGTKGLLVLLVVLGHDVVLTQRFPEFFNVVYNFHVIGFLLLPFAFSSRTASLPWTVDRATRYLVPYAVFAGLAAILYRVIEGPNCDMATWCVRVALALARGDSGSLKATTGFTAFWFLPALFSVTVLRATLRAKGVFGAGLVLLVAVLHVTIGAWPGWAKFGPPLGFTTALFVLPLGWAVEQAWPRLVSHRGKVVLAASAIALACGAIAYRTKSISNIGALTVFDWREPSKLLLHDAYAVAAFLAALAGGPWLAKVPLLVRLGRDSLAVYLTHLFATQLYVRFAHVVGIPVLGLVGLLNVAMSVVVIVALSLVAASALRAQVCQAWLFPRGVRDWPPLRRWKAAH